MATIRKVYPESDWKSPKRFCLRYGKLKKQWLKTIRVYVLSTNAENGIGYWFRSHFVFRKCKGIDDNDHHLICVLTWRVVSRLVQMFTAPWMLYLERLKGTFVAVFHTNWETSNPWNLNINKGNFFSFTSPLICSFEFISETSLNALATRSHLELALNVLIDTFTACRVCIVTILYHALTRTMIWILKLVYSIHDMWSTIQCD